MDLNDQGVLEFRVKFIQSGDYKIYFFFFGHFFNILNCFCNLEKKLSYENTKSRG